jgi:hypothetical protein
MFVRVHLKPRFVQKLGQVHVTKRVFTLTVRYVRCGERGGSRPPVLAKDRQPIAGAYAG